MLRRALPEDAGRIAAWLSDPEITRYLTSNLRGGQMTAQLVQMGLRRRDQAWFVFGEGADDSADPPQGLVAIDSIDSGDGVANLWFVLGDASGRRHGLTSRAIDALCRSNPIGLSVATAWVAEPNVASLKCLARAGFYVVGRIADAVALPEGRCARVLHARRLHAVAQG